MYSAYKLNKQGDNIQPWRTPFLIGNQSVIPCLVLTVASWLDPSKSECKLVTHSAGILVKNCQRHPSSEIHREARARLHQATVIIVIDLWKALWGYSYRRQEQGRLRLGGYKGNSYTGRMDDSQRQKTTKLLQQSWFTWLACLISPSLTVKLPRQEAGLYRWTMLNDDYRYSCTEVRASVFFILFSNFLLV